jgi:hypothetical protein
MLTTRTVSGNIIRLPEERWVHIVERHPEMAGHLEDVLVAIATPEFIFKGGNDELLAAMPLINKKWLIVVYKEESKDGFILTSFITSKTEKLFKRHLLWKK